MTQKGLPSSLDLAYEEADGASFGLPANVDEQIRQQRERAAQRRQEASQPLEMPSIPQGVGGKSRAGAGKVPYMEYFAAAAQRYGVPMNVLIGLAEQESRFNPTALGTQTKWGRAKGLMQYLDSTAAGMGINPYDPAQSIDAAARQLKQRLDKGYSMIDAVREHFAGPDRKLWGPKTHTYGVEVMQRASRYGNVAPISGGEAPSPAATQQTRPTAQSNNPDPNRFRPLSESELKKIQDAQMNGDDEVVLQIGMKPVKIMGGDPVIQKQRQQKIDDAGILSQFGNALSSGYDNTKRHVSNAVWMMTGDSTGAIADSIYEGYRQQQQAQKSRTSGQKRLDAAIDAVGDGEGFLDTLSRGLSAVKVAIQEPRATFLGSAESAASMLPTIAGGLAGAGAGGAVGAAGGAASGAVAGGVGAIPGAAAGGIGGAIWGGRIGMVAGTTASEAGAELEHMVFERLKDQKKSVTKENIQALLNDPKFRAEAQKQGTAKGLTLAMVDQLTMGAAGRVLSAPAKQAEKKAIKEIVKDTGVDEKAARSLLASPAGRAALAKHNPNTLKKAVAATGAFSIELMGEPAGEAISQAVARGEVDWSDVTGEFIYGAGTAVAGTAASGAINAGQATADRIRSGGANAQTETQAEPAAAAPVEPEAVPVPERKIGSIERAVGGEQSLDAAIDAEIAAVTGQPQPDSIEQLINQQTATAANEGTTAEQWLGQPGQTVQVSPKEDPDTTYTVTIEGYENGEVFARDQDGTPVQFGQNDIVSATPVQQTAPITENVQLEESPAPELTDFGVTASEAPAAAQTDANLSDFDTAAPQAAPDQPRAQPVEVDSPEKTLAKMDEAELRARIKYLAGQAKATGGWNKRLMEERRKVEAEINRRNKPEIDDKPYHKWEGMSPEQRQAMATKAGFSAEDAKDLSGRSWGSLDKSITDKLTAKPAPKPKAAKAPEVKQPEAKKPETDYSDAIPEQKQAATQEAAPFRQLIIDAHFNNPPMKAQLIQSEVKSGRPRHEVMKEVQGIVADINAGKITAPAAQAEAPVQETGAINKGTTQSDKATPSDRTPNPYNENELRAQVRDLNKRERNIPEFNKKVEQEFPNLFSRAQKLAKTAKLTAAGRRGNTHFKSLEFKGDDTYVSGDPWPKRPTEDEILQQAIWHLSQKDESNSPDPTVSKTSSQVKSQTDERSPLLGADGKPKWFMSEEKAQAHIEKKKLTGQYQVKKVDNRRFEIHPAEAATTPETQVEAAPTAAPTVAETTTEQPEAKQTVTQWKEDMQEALTKADPDHPQFKKLQLNAKHGLKSENDRQVALRQAREIEKQEQSAPADQFAGNKLFTADKVAAARARLKSKLGQLNSGIDPEVLVDGMTIAGAYIESGVRKFSDYAKAMVEDLGDGVKPYLLSFWEGARNYPGLDNTGMTSVEDSAKEHAALLKPEDTQTEAVGQIAEKPKARTKKTGAKGDMVLTQDWGVPQIDGYGDGTRETGNDTKDAFLKETRNYLNAVADALRAFGFEPHQDRKGKPEKPVSVNESGMAGSGDVSLTMTNPDNGNNVYITIGDSALRGVVPMTASGIAIMYRVGQNGDRYATRATNTWAPVDLSANDLATLVNSRVRPVVKTEENQNARTVQSENVPAGDQGGTQSDVTTGNRDSEPVAAGVAETSESTDRSEPVSASTQGTGRGGTRGVQPGQSAEVGPRALQEFQDLQATAEKNPVKKDQFAGLTMNGRKIADREEAVKAIQKEMVRVFAGGSDASFTYRGIEFTLDNTMGYVELNSPTGRLDYFDPSKDTLPSAAGFLTRFANYISRIPAYIEDLNAKIAEAQRDAVELRNQANNPFAQAEELNAAREAHKRVQRRLIAKGPDIPAKQKPVLDQAMEAQTAALRDQGLGDAMDEFIGSRQNSRGQVTSTGTTVAEVREALVNRFGEKTIAKLEKDGTLNIIDVLNEPGVEGFTAGGKVTLVADALTAESIVPVFLHELGGHVGFQGTMKPEAHQNLVDQFNKLVRAGDPIALEAKRLAEREADAAAQQAEYLPYLVTVAARTQNKRPGIRNLIARIVSAVKAWAVDRLGMSISLNANDVLALAERMVNTVAANSTQVANDTVSFSRADNDLAPVGQEEYRSKLGQWWSEAKQLPSDLLTNSMRGWGLNIIPLRPMLTEIAKDIPAARTYLRIKDQMDSMRNEWHAKTDAVAQNWLKYRIKHREENRDLMDLMHEATLMQVDPSKPFESILTPRERMALENLSPGNPNRKTLEDKAEKDAQRQEAHKRLTDRYNALSPEGQSIFGQVRDAYSDMADAFDQTLLNNMEKAINVRIKKAEREYKREMERIKDEGLQGEERDNAVADADRRLKNAKTKIAWNRKARMTQLRQQFETQRLAGPYFPLARFGEFFVTVRDAATGEVVSFSRFESAREQRRFADEMRKDKNYKVEVGALNDASATRKAVDPNFVADVEDILADLPNAEQVKDEVWQRYLESLPDMSIRKARIHRKGRAGYAADAVRAFGHHLFHGSHQLARMAHSMDLEDALDQARDEARETKDPTRSSLIVNEMEKRHQFVMNPTGGQLATWASSFAFVWYLAGSPKAALMNLFQTPIMGVPILGAYAGGLNGMARAGNQLTKALVDFTAGRGYAERSTRLNDDERDAMQKGYETGIIEKTQGHELAGVAESGVEYNAIRERVMKVIAWGFHHTERLNREVTFLAGYRLARAKGESHEQAITTAADLTWKTHFDYANTSRPRLMHNDTMKILLVFRNFQLNMLFRLFRDIHQVMHADSKEARREALTQLSGITGMMMLNAGITGTWGFGIAMLMAGLFMGEGEDPEEELKKGMVNMLGPNLAGLALYGAPGHITGIALSESVGMPDLWFRSPDSEKEGEEALQFWQSQLLGAVPSIGAQFARGLSYIGKGEEYRGIETMMPKMLKDPMKSYRYATEGAKNMKGDTVADVTWSDVVKQATGFTPARISEQYKINNLNYNKQQQVLKARKELMDGYYKAVKADDSAAVDEVLARIEKHNEKNPDQPITPKGLIQSIKTRERGADSAVGGMRYNNKLRERILEEQAPSIYK